MSTCTEVVGALIDHACARLGGTARRRASVGVPCGVPIQEDYTLVKTGRAVQSLLDRQYSWPPGRKVGITELDIIWAP